MEAIIVILLILLFTGGLLLAIIAYKYFSLRSRWDLEIQTKLQEKFQKWQNEQMQNIQKQMYSVAKGDAISEAQTQLNLWRENDMMQLKGQLEQSVSKEFEAKFEQWKIDTEKAIRQDAIQKSQSVTIGKVTEHIVPYLPSFKYNPKDARFLGSPVDFVLFDGLDEGQVQRVLFIEVKTSNSQLSTRERQVRNAINNGKVEWVEMRVNNSAEKASDISGILETNDNMINSQPNTVEEPLMNTEGSLLTNNSTERQQNLEKMYQDGKISKETFEYMLNRIMTSQS